VTAGADDRGYVRAVEAAWAKAFQRPSVVSPREFELVDRWRRRGVPLAVVCEVIADWAKRRGGRAPRGLTALAAAVDDAFAPVAAGRSPAGAPEVLPPRDAAMRAWETARDGLPPGSPLGAALTRLLAEAAAGAPGDGLDRALDAALPDAVPADELARIREETLRALAGFRDRMSEGEFRSASDRALADRLRATFALPRISLTR